MQDLLTDLDYAPRLASKTKRWKACFVDYLILITIAGIFSYFFGKHYTGEDGVSGWELTGAPAFFALILPWLLLFPGIESFNNGQTLGKAMFRLKTVKEDNSRLSFGNSFVKHLFDPVDYFPFFGITGLIVASNNKNKQRVGDLVAKTIVIDVGN
jgi:uncharacterized RDD family membrane protein YckC